MNYTKLIESCANLIVETDSSFQSKGDNCTETLKQYRMLHNTYLIEATTNSKIS